MQGAQSCKENTSIGIIMIATNDYILRWFSAASSLDQFAYIDYDVVRIHLFTNRRRDVEKWARINLKRTELVVHQIEGWGWPEATLYRYRFIQNSADSFHEKILMYLDSDMIVSTDFAKELFSAPWHGGLAFVQHPGYYRNTGVRGIYDYVVNPKMLLNDLICMKKGNSGLGAWEENKKSSSYVEPKKRKLYVHGAVWFGENKNLLEMCHVLSANIDQDLKRNYVAKWHDESHLNWYSANFPCSVLDVRFSYAKKFKNLSNFKPFISSVEKSKGEGRVPTKI